MVTYNPDKVKNVIFDVGNVLIDYNWHLVIKNYGYDSDKAYEAGLKMLEDEMWSKMDRGTVSLEELIEYYKGLYPEEVGMIDYFFEHKEELSIMRPELYKKIDELMDMGYGIYILSNYAEKMFNAHTKGIPFLDRVDGMVISYRVKSVKPEREIYEHLLSTYNLNPAECLFFDDKEENVEAGKALGIPGIIVGCEDDILKSLEEISEAFNKKERDYAQALCEEACEEEGVFEEFIRRLEEFPQVKREFFYYCENKDFLDKVSVSGITVSDVLIWQIDRFKAAIDEGKFALKYNGAHMVLGAFYTMCDVIENPGKYLIRFNSETGSDYPGKSSCCDYTE